MSYRLGARGEVAPDGYPGGSLAYGDTSSSTDNGAWDDSHALDVGSSSRTNVALSPTIEIGGRAALDAGPTFRPYATFGASFLPDDTRDQGQLHRHDHR